VHGEMDHVALPVFHKVVVEAVLLQELEGIVLRAAESCGEERAGCRKGMEP